MNTENNIEQSQGNITTDEQWSVVGASVTGLFFHFGSLLVVTFTIFISPLEKQFGWSRGQISLAFTLACLTALVSVPVVGILTDRYGARQLIIISMLLFGIGFGSLTFLTPKLWHLYLMFAVLGLIGPGTSAIPHASLLTQWFTKHRGAALGVMMCGTGIGGVIWPTLGQKLINTFGWRNTYAITAMGVLLIAVPILVIFLKQPERTHHDKMNPKNDELKPEIKQRTVLLSPAFILIILVFFAASAAVQGNMIHLSPMLTDRGITPTNAAFAVSLLGVANLISRLSSGWLLDRVPMSVMTILSFGTIAIASLLLLTSISKVSAFIAAALIGYGYGAITDLGPFLTARYFGLNSFGKNFSYLFLTVPLGGAIGPELMGLVFDKTHTYKIGLAASAITMLVSGALMTSIRSHRGEIK